MSLTHSLDALRTAPAAYPRVGRRVLWRTILGALLASFMAGAPADAERARPRGSPIDWQACTETALLGFECAWVPVPLDYRKPGRDRIVLAIARRRATDPARRIGTIFVNTGGPGAPVRGFVAGAAESRLSPEVRALFDVLAVDPRGVGASTAVQCFDSDLEYTATLGAVINAPRTPTEISSARTRAQRYGKACESRVGPLLKHVSTLNVVRDFERLRAALGEDRINYIGFSYGTLVGATYAALYPHRVRAMVLDGNVDPQRRTNDRLGNKFERAGGFELALDGFLSACDAAGPGCAFAGNARAKYHALIATLARGPVATSDGILSFSDVTSPLARRLYSLARFPEAAEALQAAYLAVNPALTSDDQGNFNLSPVPSEGSANPPPAYSYGGSDALFAINCVDAPLPRHPSAYAGFAAWFESTHPSFGRAEAFSELPCATWPAVTDDRYRGPWTSRADTPVLIINSTYDPATPYRFAQRMRQQLGHARLLTLDGFGHCSQASACVYDWLERYLVDRQAPPDGTRCAQDLPPFPSPGQLRLTGALVPLGGASPIEPIPGWMP